jgi:hypothetical protein
MNQKARCVATRNDGINNSSNLIPSSAEVGCEIKY